jgi:hypothetical protein
MQTTAWKPALHAVDLKEAEPGNVCDFFFADWQLHVIGWGGGGGNRFPHARERAKKGHPDQ